MHHTPFLNVKWIVKLNFFKCPLYSLQATLLQRQSSTSFSEPVMSRKRIHFFPSFLHILSNKLKYQNIWGQALKILFHSITDIETNTVKCLVFFCRQNIGTKNILLIYHFPKTILKCPENAEFHQLQWK